MLIEGGGVVSYKGRHKAAVRAGQTYQTLGQYRKSQGLTRNGNRLEDLSYLPRPEHYIPADLRRQVYERDAYRCRYCGKRGPLSVDHVVPWRQDGQTILENLVTACQHCNATKHGRTPMQAGLELRPLDSVEG